MEDVSPESRRSRPSPGPDSELSNFSRMTPQSCSDNSSAAHLPSRSSQNLGARGRESGGSSLLQERLRERKVESARQNRRSIDMSADVERMVQSSPLKATTGRDERRPSSSGVGLMGKKGMGVKQMEEQVSTLHKQNFDLKLELFHRRQRQEVLEARLEAAEKQIVEQNELQKVNEQLLAELENRDQAVEEAVSIIVSLEERLEKLQQEREIVIKFDTLYESGYRGSHDDGLPSSPPALTRKEANSARPSIKSKAVARMPSFLSEHSEGAEALRSLYLPTLTNNYSDTTLPKLSEEGGTADGMNSPRLSVLSESSFLSVYGEQPLSLDATNGLDEEGTSPPRRHRKSTSVEKWIDERPVPTTSPLRARAEALRKNQFLSINDVLESPLQRLEKLKLTLENHNSSLTVSRLQGNQERAASVKENRKSREILRRVFTNSASFEHPEALPPTPDTISTSTLRLYKNSSDTLSRDRHPNDADPKKTLNSISTFQVPTATYNAYQSTLSVRPRSAGETITSRRDGHGWDTETQENMSESETVSSLASTGSAQPLPSSKHAITPDLFMFGTHNDHDTDRRAWGRDMMYNDDSTAPLPSQTANRYDSLRRSSVVERPIISDPAAPNHNIILTTYHGEDLHYGINPIDTSPRPDLPDRRSSLSATAKLRKMPPPEMVTPTGLSTQATVTPSPSYFKEKDSKRSRTTGRMFGRSGQSPAPFIGVSDQQQPSISSTASGQARERGGGHIENGRSQSFVASYGPRLSNGMVGVGSAKFEEDEYSRATPPPIKRSRTMHTSYGGRPSSAGVGVDFGREVRLRVGFGGDGANDDVGGNASGERRVSVDVGIDAERNARKEDGNIGGKTGGGGGPRKWFGIGRAGSLRR